MGACALFFIWILSTFLFAGILLVIGNKLSLLHLMSLTGNEYILDYLNKFNLDINRRASDGSSPLTWSAYRGSEVATSFFLRHGADVNSALKDGSTTLFWTALQGHSKIVNILLEHGADVDVTTFAGYSALHAASSKGYVDIVKALLQKGANIDLRDKHGNCPIILAMKNNHQEVARLLIESGADLMAPLGIAIDSERIDLLQILLKSGRISDINNAVFPEGPGQLTGLTASKRAVLTGNIEVLEALVAAGVNLNARSENDNDTSVLHFAVVSNFIPVVRRLVELGAELSPHSKQTESVLHAAARYGYADMCKTLIQLGANVKVRCDSSSGIEWTPLHTAAYTGGFPVVRALVEIGHASVDVRTGEGRTALILAAQAGDTPTVRFLLDSGADIEAYSKSRLSALSEAVAQGHVQTVQLLIERGAELQPSQFKPGQTLMHIVAENAGSNDGHEYAEIVSILAKAGVAANSPFEDMLPIHLAAGHGCKQATLQALQQAGADVNAASERTGSTALHFAAGNGHLDTVRSLIRLGSLTSALDNTGSSPLQVGIASGLDPLVARTLSALLQPQQQQSSRKVIQEQQPATMASNGRTDRVEEPSVVQESVGEHAAEEMEIEVADDGCDIRSAASGTAGDDDDDVSNTAFGNSAAFHSIDAKINESKTDSDTDSHIDTDPSIFTKRADGVKGIASADNAVSKKETDGETDGEREVVKGEPKADGNADAVTSNVTADNDTATRAELDTDADAEKSGSTSSHGSDVDSISANLAHRASNSNSNSNSNNNNRDISSVGGSGTVVVDGEGALRTLHSDDFDLVVSTTEPLRDEHNSTEVDATDKYGVVNEAPEATLKTASPEKVSNVISTLEEVFVEKVAVVQVPRNRFFDDSNETANSESRDVVETLDSSMVGTGLSNSDQSDSGLKSEEDGEDDEEEEEEEEEELHRQRHHQVETGRVTIRHDSRAARAADNGEKTATEVAANAAVGGMATRINASSSEGDNPNPNPDPNPDPDSDSNPNPDPDPDPNPNPNPDPDPDSDSNPSEEENPNDHATGNVVEVSATATTAISAASAAPSTVLMSTDSTQNVTSATTTKISTSAATATATHSTGAVADNANPTHVTADIVTAIVTESGDAASATAQEVKTITTIETATQTAMAGYQYIPQNKSENEIVVKASKLEAEVLTTNADESEEVPEASADVSETGEIGNVTIGSTVLNNFLSDAAVSVVDTSADIYEVQSALDAVDLASSAQDAAEDEAGEGGRSVLTSKLSTSPDLIALDLDNPIADRASAPDVVDSTRAALPPQTVTSMSSATTADIMQPSWVESKGIVSEAVPSSMKPLRSASWSTGEGEEVAEARTEDSSTKDSSSGVEIESRNTEFAQAEETHTEAAIGEEEFDKPGPEDVDYEYEYFQYEVDENDTSIIEEDGNFHDDVRSEL